MDLSAIGKTIIGMGILLVIVGVLFIVMARLTGDQGWRVPGDFTIRRDNVSITVMIGTSLLISAVLTILFYLISLTGRR